MKVSKAIKVIKRHNKEQLDNYIRKQSEGKLYFTQSEYDRLKSAYEKSIK